MTDIIRFRGCQVLSLCLAAVWLYHGLFNKLLGLEPRHLLIVQSVPGLQGAAGEAMLAAVGAGETALAAWILTGAYPRAAAAVQTAALLSMNVLELTWARPHLLFPAALLPINLLFLGGAWMNAALTRASARRPRHWLYRLRRHPFPVKAFFRHSLVLTYAFPREILEPLLPPGLALDTHDGFGFVAIAMVQTRGLRPSFMPSPFGQNFFLAGYRIFTRFTHDGRTRRGLRILRSDADRALMVFAGNVLTHYNYRRCRADVRSDGATLQIDVRTPKGEADVQVIAHLDEPQALPPGSPFESVEQARRFAGPLPWTFDYEPQTHSIIAIKGNRSHWSPRLVKVDVHEAAFLRQPPFDNVRPVLASAFHVHDIPYRWERGVRFPLPEARP